MRTGTSVSFMHYNIDCLNDDAESFVVKPGLESNPFNFQSIQKVNHRRELEFSVYFLNLLEYSKIDSIGRFSS
jgi:hypothetical protein